MFLYWFVVKILRTGFWWLSSIMQHAMKKTARRTGKNDVYLIFFFEAPLICFLYVFLCYMWTPDWLVRFIMTDGKCFKRWFLKLKSRWTSYTDAWMITPENTQWRRMLVYTCPLPQSLLQKNPESFGYNRITMPLKMRLITTLTVPRRLEFIHDGMRLRVPRKIASDFALCKFN